MKVRELLEQLSPADPEAEVILASDAEGNRYSPLAEVATENLVYLPQTTWSGNLCFQKLTEELIESGFTEEDVCTEGGQKCILLEPTN